MLQWQGGVQQWSSAVAGIVWSSAVAGICVFYMDPYIGWSSAVAVIVVVAFVFDSDRERVNSICE